MGRLVVTEFVTLDGVFEDPGGAASFEHGGWVFRFDQGEDGPRFKLDEIMGAEAQLLGRVTYEGFAEAWPGRTDDAGFAARMNAMPKYVVSTTLAGAEWQTTTVLRGPLAAEVAAVKARHAGPRGLPAGRARRRGDPHLRPGAAAAPARRGLRCLTAR